MKSIIRFSKSGNFTHLKPGKELLFFLISGLLLFFNEQAHSQTLEELNNKVFEYYRKEDYKTALEYSEKLVAQAKTELGESDPVYTSLVNNLALLYFKTEDYPNAKASYEYVIKKQMETVTLSETDFMIALNNLAASYYKTGDYGEAETYYILLTDIYKKSGEENDPMYLSSLNNLANVYKAIGNYKKAESVFLNVLQIEKASGNDHSSTLSDLASLYDDMGEYSKSEKLYLEILEIQKKTVGENDPDYTQTLNNLAFLYFHMGNFAKSESIYLKAIKIRKDVLGETHYLYASSLNNLAGLYESIGEYAKAEPLFVKALEIRKNTLGETHLLYAGTLNNLAVLYYYMGDYGKAIPLYLKTIEIYKSTLGEAHPDYANALNNLAELYQDIGGEFSKAESLYLQALEIQKNALGETNLLYASYLNNLAELYEKKGYYFKAEPLLFKSLEIQKNIVGENHPYYALSLNNLGSLYLEMGDYTKAKPFFIQALDIRKTSLGETNHLYASSLNNLALLYNISGDNTRAEAMFSEAKKIVLQNIDKNFSFLSESEKEKYTATVSYQLKIYQNFYLRYKKTKPSVAGEAFDTELATKGMILNSGMQMRQSILNSGNEEALKLYDEWIAVKSALAKQYGLPIDKRTLDVSIEEEHANELEKQLTVLSSSFKEAESLLSNNWTDIQKKLGPHEVAIEFTSFQLNNKKKFIDSTMYVALVLRKGDTYPKMVPLCEARQLESLLKKENSSDAGFISGLYRGADLLNQTIDVSNGKILYQLIWKPLDSLLLKGNTVYFAPSGILHQIAFAAIPYDDKSSLSDRYKLNQLSTTATLLRQSKFTDTIPKNMVVYGGIQYEVEEKDLLASAEKEKSGKEYVSRSLPAYEKRKETWNYLPGTLTEANNISSIAKEKKIQVKSYSGKDAVEESFKNLSGNNSPGVIHIATHGFFFPDPENDSASGSVENKKVFHTSDDPLNRAGLLFAGASKAWNGETLPSNVEDGILTAYEAANVSLSNTRLLVLSACETGLGEIKGSEGVFGLQRAFKMAGAEYLLMSLWKVPDAETAEFMSDFYTVWFSGKSIPDAFHATQTYMKTKYPKDPYKWAAFVLVR